VLVDVWPGEGGLALELDTDARALVSAVVLNKALAPAARRAGWRETKIPKAQAGQLAYLTDARPDLKKDVDFTRAWRPSARPLDLGGLRARGGPQPFLLLLKPKARRGAGSVLVHRGGDLRGGMTIVNLARA
jgi:hypothetical protein